MTQFGSRPAGRIIVFFCLLLLTVLSGCASVQEPNFHNRNRQALQQKAAPSIHPDKPRTAISSPDERSRTSTTEKTRKQLAESIESFQELHLPASKATGGDSPSGGGTTPVANSQMASQTVSDNSPDRSKRSSDSPESTAEQSSGSSDQGSYRGRVTHLDEGSAASVNDEGDKTAARTDTTRRKDPTAFMDGSRTNDSYDFLSNDNNGILSGEEDDGSGIFNDGIVQRQRRSTRRGHKTARNRSNRQHPGAPPVNRSSPKWNGRTVTEPEGQPRSSVKSDDGTERRSMVYALLSTFLLGLLAGVAFIGALWNNRLLWFLPARSGTEDRAPPEADRGDFELRKLPLDRIIANPFQPRRFIDEGRLEELQQSIQEYGVITPIQVTTTDDGQYQLIAGERRVRACRRLNKDRIPAVIRDIDGQELIEVGFLENLQHEPMHPVEKADLYRRLREEFRHLSIEELSEIVGKPPAEIRTYEWIHDLAPVAQQAFAKGVLEEHEARLIRRASSPAQGKLVEFVAEENPDEGQLRDKVTELENDDSGSDSDDPDSYEPSTRESSGLHPGEMGSDSPETSLPESNAPVMNLDNDNRVDPPP